MIPARLVPAGKRPPAEAFPPEPMGQCDANASGAEDALIRLAKGRRILSLCVHHFHAHEYAMSVAGWEVIRDSRPDQSPPRS